MADPYPQYVVWMLLVLLLIGVNAYFAMDEIVKGRRGMATLYLFVALLIAGTM